MNWWLLITGGMVVWVGGNAIVIILQRRSAAATIAWLLGLVFLPIIGMLLYTLIGPLRLERRKRRRVRARRILDEGLRGMAALEPDEEHHQLAQVSLGLGGSPPLRAEAFEIYFDGASTFEAILGAIADARDHIHLEYYIWEPDTIGTQMRDALVAKARAGVKVRLLLDGTGSNNIRSKWLAPLREAGASVAWFNPVRLRTLRSRRADFRTHRKIVVCDGRIGFTGGMNIVDEQSASHAKEFWRDTHMRLVGAAVWPMQRVFFEDWHYATQEQIEVTKHTVPPPQREGPHLVQIVASGPDGTTFDLHKVFFTAINQATRRCWLTTPYFVPDEALLSALVTASLRGVDVRVIVPARGDSRLVDYAARSYFPELLESKVRVFEYTTRFIHAKTMLCDDDIAIVGTANFDNRSFRLDFEIAAVIFGAAGNRQLADAFERDLGDSREVHLDAFTSRTFGRRLGEASARLLSPLL